MTAAAQRLSALNKLKDQRLSSDLLKDFSLEQLTNAFDRLDLTHFPFELGPGTTDLQKALLEHEGFFSTLRRLLEDGMTPGQVQNLMNAAKETKFLSSTCLPSRFSLSTALIWTVTDFGWIFISISASRVYVSPGVASLCATFVISATPVPVPWPL